MKPMEERPSAPKKPEMSPETRKAFEASFKRHEEALRRLARREDREEDPAARLGPVLPDLRLDPRDVQHALREAVLGGGIVQPRRDGLPHPRNGRQHPEDIAPASAVEVRHVALNEPFAHDAQNQRRYSGYILK